MRLKNTWHEIRDHSFIQNHSRSSDSQLLLFSSTGFRSEEWMARAEAWFCAQWPIFVLFLRFVFGLLYGWRIQTWPIIRCLTESVTHWSFICWYLIESWCRVSKQDVQTSSRNIGPQHKKYRSVFHCTHGVLLSLCSPNPSWVFATKKLFFSFIWP